VSQDENGDYPTNYNSFQIANSKDNYSRRNVENNYYYMNKYIIHNERPIIKNIRNIRKKYALSRRNIRLIKYYLKKILDDDYNEKLRRSIYITLNNLRLVNKHHHYNMLEDIKLLKTLLIKRPSFFKSLLKLNNNVRFLTKLIKKHIRGGQDKNKLLYLIHHFKKHNYNFANKLSRKFLNHYRRNNMIDKYNSNKYSIHDVHFKDYRTRREYDNALSYLLNN